MQCCQLLQLMDYSEGDCSGGEWRSGRGECGCSEEVALLQAKLAEVHGRLMAQIEICQQQQTRIIFLETGHSGRGKENQGRNWQESREGSEIKNELLQSDLEAMRRRVLAEITEKNRLLEEMGDLKKRHRKEMALEATKFEGLEILYRKAMAEKGEKGREPPQDQRTTTPPWQALETDLAREREHLRKLNAENKRLRDALTTREGRKNEERESRKESKGRKEGKEKSEGRESSEELREMGVLKQQISRINRGINVREEGMPLEMKLVGDRWGQRHH